MKGLSKFFTILAVVSAVSVSVHGQQADRSLQVVANAVGGCDFEFVGGVQALHFGVYDVRDPQPTTGLTQFWVRCSPGTGLRVIADSGLYGNPQTGRAMAHDADGSVRLGYRITPAALPPIIDLWPPVHWTNPSSVYDGEAQNSGWWGDSMGNALALDVPLLRLGELMARIRIDGVVHPGQDALPGSYSDTVTMTFVVF